MAEKKKKSIEPSRISFSLLGATSSYQISDFNAQTHQARLLICLLM
jgi:hypothetical protein